MNRTPVVLIHGAWFHRSSWERWAERFTGHGYAVHVPGWPGEAGSAAEERSHPGRNRDLGLEALLTHYEQFVRSLGSPPVLIGHALGGLMVQHLFSLRLGRAAVALAPWPGDGADAREIRSRLWPLVPVDSGDQERSVQLSRADFRHMVANTVGEEEAAQLYARHVVPASRRLLADLGFEHDGERGPSRPTRIVVDTADTKRGPLLLISGQEDQVIPDAVTRAGYKSYGDSTAITELKQFADRGHSLVIDCGWRAVADHVLAWLAGHEVKAPR